MVKRIALALMVAVFAVVSFTGCQPTPKLSGNVVVDGSSTVFLITEAVAEEFMAVNKEVKVSVGISGTGGGFKKWAAGETDINDASRKIKQKEIDPAKANNIDPVEMPVAYDGITVVVNKNNTWVDKVTVEELRLIWDAGSTVKYWSDVRASWPKEEIKLFGPGHDSGTFQYFTEAINGEEGKSRADYTASEDDNQLVIGVENEANSFGYFGYAYFAASADRMRAVPVVNEAGDTVLPSIETIADGSYNPLARVIYIYPSKQALEQKPQVAEFVKFYMENAKPLVAEVGYIPLADSVYSDNLNLIPSKLR